MEIILNKSYGCFIVPHEICAILNCSRYADTKAIRTNPIFISWVKENSSLLYVVTVPSKATDWRIIGDDEGFEHIICVIDGKMVDIWG